MGDNRSDSPQLPLNFESTPKAQSGEVRQTNQNVRNFVDAGTTKVRNVAIGRVASSGVFASPSSTHSKK